MQRLPKFLQKKLQLGGANILGEGNPFAWNTNNYQHPTRPTNYLQPIENNTFRGINNWQTSEYLHPKNPDLQTNQNGDVLNAQTGQTSYLIPEENRLQNVPSFSTGIKPIQTPNQKNPNKQPLIDGMYVGNALLRGFSENYSNNQRRQYEQDNLNQLGFNDGRSRDVKYGYQQFQKGGSTIDKLMPLPKQSLNRGDMPQFNSVIPLTKEEIETNRKNAEQEELKRQAFRGETNTKYIGRPTGKLSLEERNDRLKQLAQEQGLSYENGRTNTLFVPGSKTENTINRAGDLIEKGVEAEMLISGAGLVGNLGKAGFKQLVKQFGKKEATNIAKKEIPNYLSSTSQKMPWKDIPNPNYNLNSKNKFLDGVYDSGKMEEGVVKGNPSTQESITNNLFLKKNLSPTTDPFIINSEATMFADETGNAIYKLDPEDYKNFETKKMYEEAVKDNRDYKRDYFNNKFTGNSKDIALKSFTNKQDYPFLHSKLNNENISKQLSEELSKRRAIGQQAFNDLGLTTNKNQFNSIPTKSDEWAKQNIIKHYNPNKTFGYNNFAQEELDSRFLKSIDDMNFADDNFKNSLPKNKYGGKTALNKKQQGGSISKLGYSRNSPYKNSKFLDIHSPTGDITMENTEFPLLGEDEHGFKQLMLPGNNYKFRGQHIRETPIMQQEDSNLVHAPELKGYFKKKTK